MQLRLYGEILRFGTLEERLGIRVAFGGERGGGGGRSRSGFSDEQNVNRKDKRNRDGTKNTVGRTIGHIGAQILKETNITVGPNGVSVSGKANCGSCHDPYGDRRRGHD